MCNHCHQNCCNHDHEHDHTHGHAHEHGSTSRYRQFIPELSTALILILLYFINPFLQTLSVRLDLPEQLLPAAAYAIALIPVAKNIVVETVKFWLKGDFFNEFSLMLLACIGAFVIGEFPEGVAILLFYSIGEKLEDLASDKARNRIRSLINRLPKKVEVEHEGTVIQKKPEDVVPGEIIIVKPGDTVPLDCQLLNRTEKNAISFDSSAITGESMPTELNTGESVMSGYIPVDTEVRLRVTHAYNESSMTRIMQMIEDATARKSNSETLLRRITRYYTPVVMLASVLLFIVPFVVSLFNSAFHFEWQVWMERALVLLVCSCPCALVVSIPLSYFAAIGNASRFGILFKGSRYVDMLRSVDTLMLDKTGTLTTGDFSVVSVSCATITSESISEETVLLYAAAIDAQSNHPLAKAIVKEASKHGEIPKAEDVTTIPHGMRGHIDGMEIIVGSKRLFNDDIHLEATATSAVHIGINGKYAGTIYLADTLRADIAGTIADLRKSGIKKIEILSGDRKEAVADVSNRVGADDFKAELLPARKHEILTLEKQQGKRVAFVGDGINDAPALALADVGIAIGAGTDIAIESADAVITGKNLRAFVNALRLSHRIKHVVTLNVSIAIGAKLVVMILGALGIATLWAAVFADTGITLITILLTLILLRTKKSDNE